MGGTLRRLSLVSVLAVVISGMVGQSARAMAADLGDIERVSVSNDEAESNGHSSLPTMSSDGRFVVFESVASNLVDGDTNGQVDVFVRDRATGGTERVSVSSDGAQAIRHAFLPSISPDGRFVAFYSVSSNLVPGDSNDVFDVFVHDRQSGKTERVSVSSEGVEGDRNSVSSPGSSISEDGRFVVFDSVARNLVDGDTNGVADVFVHDRRTGRTTRASVTSDGEEGDGASLEPVISADGRFIAFRSDAENLVEGDTNREVDVFVHDRETGNTTRVSVSDSGSQGNRASLYPSISANGRFVAFGSGASNLVEGDTNERFDVYLHDRRAGDTSRVSVTGEGVEANHDSFTGVVSRFGRFVAFDSDATNLVDGDTNGAPDVFLRDRQSGTTERVSVSSEGNQANDSSGGFVDITPDGTTVAFGSLAANLVEPDGNDRWDVFAKQVRLDGECRASFSDTWGHLFEEDVACIADAAITLGCNPPANDRFCPTDEVTRGEMAAFLVRGLDLPAAGDQGFTDVGDSVFRADIDSLAAVGITIGCNPPENDRFCPADEVTRGEMAAFLVRGLGLPSAEDQGFTDVGDSVFRSDIDSLAAAGITRGCNPPENDRFCPTDEVSRGQMAAFLNRALLEP